LKNINSYSLSNITLCAGLCLLVGCVYWLPALWAGYNARIDLDFPNADYHSYYVAGKAYFLGVNPYLDNRFKYPELNNPRINGFSGYIYPPTALPMYELLGLLSYKYARAIWACLNLGVLLLTFITMLSLAKREDRLPLFLAGSILILTSSPLIGHIQQGQVDMIPASMGMLSYLAYRSQKKILSIVLLNLAVFIKLNPIVLLATFVLFHRDLKYLLWFGFFFLIFFTASLLYIPFGYYSDFVTKVLPIITQSRGYFSNQSLIQLSAYKGSEPLQISAAGFLIFSGFAWLTGQYYKRHPHPMIEEKFLSDVVFLMNVLALLLFSGLAWTMAYVWVILPASQVLVALWRMGKPWYFGLVSVAMILVNSKPQWEPVILQRLNMDGGLMLLGLLMIMMITPNFMLKSTSPVERAKELIPAPSKEFLQT
jgi:hypothetical protein